MAESKGQGQNAGWRENFCKQGKKKGGDFQKRFSCLRSRKPFVFFVFYVGLVRNLLCKGEAYDFTGKVLTKATKATKVTNQNILISESLPKEGYCQRQRDELAILFVNSSLTNFPKA
jgi:hypothetical protein